MDHRLLGLLLATGVAWSAALPASSGVIEIHPACVATGCFAGDSPGFPVTLDAPGSYRLTASLEVPTGVVGIVLDASGITLDLGGYGVLGTVICSGGVPTCTSGSALGIASGPGLDLNDIEIHNGIVSGFQTACIDLSQGGNPSGTVLRNLRISNCAGPGIRLIGSAVIDSVSVKDCGDAGIDAIPSTLVRNSLIVNNGLSGVNSASCSANVFESNAGVAPVAEENCAVDIDPSLCGGVLCP